MSRILSGHKQLAVGVLVVLVVLVGVFGNARADSSVSCGFDKVGVTEVASTQGVRTISTVRTRFRAGDAESLRLAQSDGEIRAKTQLLKYKSGGKSASGNMNGVIVLPSCERSGYLYVTVQLSSSSKKASRSLKDQIDHSIAVVSG